jgi:hypothetical protein
MKLEFQCPWCGCEAVMRGPDASGSWRFRVPCDLCERDMILTWDGGLVVSRGADRMARSDDDTKRIRFAKAAV